MEKTYKYRIYPNKEQKVQMAKTFGCARFVYNHYLDIWKRTHGKNQKSPVRFEYTNRLTVLKSEHAWLKEVDSTALQSALGDLETACRNFSRGLTACPRFKSKRNRGRSYRSKCVNQNIQYLDRHIKLPKLGTVRTRNKLVPQGRVLSATVSQNPAGRYYVSIHCTDVPAEWCRKTGRTVGIDLGLTDFAVTSEGMRFQNPRYLRRSLDRFVKLQKSLSRKQKDSKNREKIRLRTARLYEHVSNQKNDYLHKLSTWIVEHYDVICMENLSVKEVSPDRKLTKCIFDAGWAEFTRQLEYKARWHGRTIVKVDRWFPSSQTCHACGTRSNVTKDLSVREWDCPNCGAHLERDENAAINILNEGLRMLKEA